MFKFFRAEEMFLLGNSLPYKNKDVSLIPRIHIKKKVWYHMLMTLSLVMLRARIEYSESPRLVRHPVTNKNMNSP